MKTFPNKKSALFVISVLVLCPNLCKTLKLTEEDYALLPPIFKLDDYDLCLSVQNSTYCYAKIQVLPKNPTKPTKIWRIIEEVNRSPKNYRHDWLRYGICMPNWSWSATKNLHGELSKEIQKRLQSYGLRGNLLEVHCENQKSPYEIKNFDRIFGALIIVYVIFLVVSSFLVHFHGNPEGSFGRWSFFWKTLDAFSIPKNYQRLKTPTDSSDGKLFRFIQGVRFYNMCCIILAHTCMTLMAGPIWNTRFVERMTEDPLNAFLYNGNSIVQTFFVISGWLLSYHFCLIFEKSRKIKMGVLVWAFIKRYLRLTPIVALTVAFHSTFLVHLGRGPVWDLIVGTEYRNCRKNWWTNLLYINNYYDSKNMCMQQTWYLATDTQAFLVSLLLLALMWRFQKYTKLILGVATIVFVSIPGIVNYVHGNEIVFRIYPEFLYYYLLNSEEWHTSLSQGHTHFGAYTIGLATGIAFYKYRGKSFLKNNKVYITLWWFFGFVAPILVVLSGWIVYQDGFTYTRFESALYMSLNKNSFAFFLALFMFGLGQGEGWFAKWFCEWEPVQVLGKLTYSTYIFHLGIMKIKAALTRQPVYLNNYLLLIYTLGDVASSYMAAFIICVFFEMPITALIKLFVPEINNNEFKPLTKEN